MIAHSPQPSLARVTRLLLAFLLAFSLATGSGPAFAGPASDCPMTKAPGGMANHDKMGCCGSDCAVTCPPAMLTADPVELATIEPSSGPTAALPLKSLPSVNPLTIDPPPRTGTS